MPLAGLTLLTPLGALLAVGIALPAAAAVLAARRVARGRALLGLAAPLRGRDAVLLSLAAVPLILGVAATQPALRTRQPHLIRTDAEAFFVFDVSRSMLASAGPHAPTRLLGAKAAALQLRAAIPDVPAGVASLTDRVLPHLFPTVDPASFTSTVREAIGIEQPPPQAISPVATSFAPLAQIATQGYFQPATKRRVVVLLTDGESRPFDAGSVGHALQGSPSSALVVVRIWSAGDRVYRPNGGIEGAYRPDARSAELVAQLATAAAGRAFDASQLTPAADALRADAGTGPTRQRGLELRTTTLTPYVALSALAPLAFLLWRRNVR